jgi:hypothetical protein
MSDDAPPAQQTGCGLANILVPMAMLAGGVVGWTLARPFGLVPAILGSGVGAVLGIPAFGLAVAAVVGVLYLCERLARRSRHEGAGSDSRKE